MIRKKPYEYLNDIVFGLDDCFDKGAFFCYVYMKDFELSFSEIVILDKSFFLITRITKNTWYFGLYSYQWDTITKSLIKYLDSHELLDT